MICENIERWFSKWLDVLSKYTGLLKIEFGEVLNNFVAVENIKTNFINILKDLFSYCSFLAKLMTQKVKPKGKFQANLK